MTLDINSKRSFFLLLSQSFISFVFLLLASVPIKAEILPGSISGDFNVTQSGASSYTIPIKITPGTGGVQPSISISYSSQGGQSAAGLGWSINGFSAITRGPKNLLDDDEVRGVLLDDKDSLFLDGQKLVSVKRIDSNTTEYRTLMNNHSRVISIQKPSSDKVFIVKTKAGLTMEYKKPVKLDDGRTLAWLCSRISDSVGNFMEFEYFLNGTGHYVVSKVLYTGNDKAELKPYATVEFEYEETKGDFAASDQYLLGNKIVSDKRLTKITSRYNESVFREYRLTHRRTLNKTQFRLESIQEFGQSGQTHNPTTFVYGEDTQSEKKWAFVPNLQIPSYNLSTDKSSAYLLINLDNNEYPDLIYSEIVEGELKTHALLGRKNSWGKPKDKEYIFPVALGNTGEYRLAKPVDINQDGIDEVFLIKNDSTVEIYELKNKIWTKNEALSKNILSDTPIKVHEAEFVDADADGKLDLLFKSNQNATTTSIYLQKVDGWSASDSHSIDSLFSNISVSDYNCDGSNDIAIFEHNEDQSLTVKASFASTAGWIESATHSSITLSNIPSQGWSYVSQDLNGDACADLVISFQSEELEGNTFIDSTATGFLLNQNLSESLSGIVLHDNLDNFLFTNIDNDDFADLLVGGSAGTSAFRQKEDSGDRAWELWDLNLDALPLDTNLLKSQENVADLDNDNIDEFIFYNSFEGGFKPQIYKRFGEGWTIALNRTPPVEFAKFDKIDLGAQFIDLNGDGLQDILAKGQSYKNTGNGWAKFKSVDGADCPKCYKSPTNIALENGGDAGVRLLDINQDGLVDFVFSIKDKAGNIRRGAHVNNGNTWVKSEAFTSSLDQNDVVLSIEGQGPTGTQILDLNGDGRVDIISSFLDAEGNNRSYNLINDGESWQQPQNDSYNLCNIQNGYCTELAFQRAKIEPSVGILVQTNPTYKNYSTGSQIFDLNGDSLPDVLFSYLVFNGKWTRNSLDRATKEWFDSNPGVLPPDDLKNAKVGELDRYSKVVKNGALLNTGKGWNYKADYLNGVEFRLDGEPEKTNDNKSTLSVFPVDHNSDGLTDLHFAERRWLPEFKRSYSVYTNTGNGFQKDTSGNRNLLRINDSLVPSDSGNYTDLADLGFRFLDINGDGYVDVLQGLQNESGGWLHRGAWLNNGIKWVEDSSYKPELPFSRILRGDQGVRLSDINGDGLLDYIQSFVESRKGKTNNVKKAFLNSANSIPFLKSITDGHFNKTLIQYQSMSAAVEGNDSVYSNDRSSSAITYPLIHAVPSIHLVRSSTLFVPAYRGTTLNQVRYKYSGFKVNVLSGQSAGFARKEEFNLATHTYSKTEYLQACVPDKKETCYLDGRSSGFESGFINKNNSKVPLLVKNSAWKLEAHQGLRREFYSLANASTVEEKNDEKSRPTGVKSEKLVYGGLENSNLIESKVTLNQSYITHTQNKYEAEDHEKWFLSRLTSATVTRTDSATGESETRKSCFKYHRDSGLLKNQYENCGHEKQVTKTLKYDLFGNQIEETLEASEVLTRTTNSEYDNQGRLLVNARNAKGHKSQTIKFDRVKGISLITQDANGLEVSQEVNDFGEITRMVDSTGLITVTNQKVNLDNCKSEYVRECYRVTTKTGDLPESVAIYDSAGRNIENIAVGFGGKTVHQKFKFNHVGKLVMTSLPMFENDFNRQYSKPEDFESNISNLNCSKIYETGNLSERLADAKFESPWSRNYYDRLGRVTKTINPNGAIYCNDYDGRITYSYDALGRYTTTTVDEQLRTTKVVDALGGETRFTYDVAGRVTETINALNQSIQTTYNDLGKRTRVQDPDLGVWHYKYDSLGQLIWQRDAKGQETELIYDQLGRLIEKKQIDRVSNWEYDKQSFGIGLLSHQKDNAGFSEIYTYDEHSRIASQSTLIDGNEFIQSLTYDELGRAKSTTSPNGYILTNEYDEIGFLSSVNGLVPNNPDQAVKTHWQALEYDAAGRVLSERLGDGVETINEYDQFSGQLDSTLTQSPNQNGQSLNHFEFEYDLADNLVEKRDRFTGRVTINDFDELDRLASSTHREQFRKEKFSYDKIGNFLDRSDFGSYQYAYQNGGISNQLVSVKLPSKKSIEFEYDANGNTVRSNKGRFSYTSENLVKEIKKSWRRYSRFRYAPGGSRYFQDYRDGRRHLKTTYLGGYEKIQEIGAEPLFPTSERIRHRHYIVGSSGVVGVFEEIQWLYPVGHSRKFENLTGIEKPEHTVQVTYKSNYFLKDNLGSITAIVDKGGAELNRFEYDAWGKRIEDKYKKYNTYRRGFTGHEHLDNLNLIHMNGRVYDPDLGRFISADPFVQAPTSSQNYSRYNYVQNNPYKYTDPSGYLFSAVKKFVKSIGRGLQKVWDVHRNAIKKVGKWLKENWREVVTVIVVVAVVYFTAGAGSAWLGSGSFFTTSVGSGMAAGFAGGATSTALYGGDFGDIMEAGIKGAIIGGATAGIAEGWANVSQGTFAEGSIGRAFGHGVSGGVSSELQGGEFMEGFGSAAFTHMASPVVNNLQGFEGAQLARISASAAIGGTASVIGGGKFSNGAITATYQRMFNDELHSFMSELEYQSRMGDFGRVKYNASPPQTEKVFGYGDSYGSTADSTYCLARMCMPDGSLTVSGGSEKHRPINPPYRESKKFYHSRNSTHYPQNGARAIDISPGRNPGLTQPNLYQCAKACGFTHGQWEKNHWHLQKGQGNGSRPLP